MPADISACTLPPPLQGSKPVNSKNFKQQERQDSKRPKFGAAEMESWKKNWK